MYRSILILTGVFAALCAGTLLLPLPVGWQFLILVLLFAALFGSFSFRHRTEWPELWRVWLFSTLVSFFQVFPDWFLSAVLEVLIFPEDGLFKFGTVSGYMAGLWAYLSFIFCWALGCINPATHPVNGWPMDRISKGPWWGLQSHY